MLSGMVPLLFDILNFLSTRISSLDITPSFTWFLHPKCPTGCFFVIARNKPIYLKVVFRAYILGSIFAVALSHLRKRWKPTNIFSLNITGSS